MNSPPLTLPPYTLDIWEIPLPPVSLEILSLYALSPDELLRFHRFHFERHRRRFAQARIALRTILGKYLQQKPETLIFEYTAHGKPYLSHFPTLQFNLSHSKDLALLGICEHHAVGIDVEFFSTRPFLGIAKQLFSQKEQTELATLLPSFMPLGFFSVWAQKEAVIKQVGLGLSYPTQSIDLWLLPHGPYHVYEPQSKQTLSLTPFMPAPAVSAAVCYHPSLTQTRYFSYDPATSYGYSKSHYLPFSGDTNRNSLL